MKSVSRVLGVWRITETEVWAPDALDLMGPARLTLRPGGLGEIAFIAIRADVDYRVSTLQGHELIEFTWQGEEEGDEICGRGWATMRGDELAGQLFIHRGDESSFYAKREGSARRLSGGRRLRAAGPSPKVGSR
jgi:hypothetical protein